MATGADLGTFIFDNWVKWLIGIIGGAVLTWLKVHREKWASMVLYFLLGFASLTVITFLGSGVLAQTKAAGNASSGAVSQLSKEDISSALHPLESAIIELRGKIQTPRTISTTARTQSETPIQVTPDTLGTLIAQWTDNLHYLRRNNLVPNPSFFSYTVSAVNSNLVFSRTSDAPNYLTISANMQADASNQALFDKLPQEELQKLNQELDEEIGRRSDISFSRQIKPFTIALQQRILITGGLTEGVIQRAVNDMDILVLVLKNTDDSALRRSGLIK